MKAQITDVSPLYRAVLLLKTFLASHPEHDQADIRVFDAYEELLAVIKDINKSSERGVR